MNSSATASIYTFSIVKYATKLKRCGDATFAALMLICSRLGVSAPESPGLIEWLRVDDEVCVNREDKPQRNTKESKHTHLSQYLLIYAYKIAN